MSTQSVQYGTTEIQYELTYAQRKTLGISVRPDLQVTVKAPEGTPLEDIEARVLKRAPCGFPVRSASARASRRAAATSAAER